MDERLATFGDPPREDRSPEWVALVPALLVLVIIVIVDILFGRSVVIVGVLAVAPFLTALRGARSATVVVALATIVVAASSGLWNDNYDLLDFWVRFTLVVAASAFACYSAWRRRKPTHRPRASRDRGHPAARAAASGIPEISGWSVAALYRPVGTQNLVGGDFYDLFRLEDSWMVVVGDVTGHGARAASITALARFTLRTAAVLTNNPIEALAELNRALVAQQHGALCSVAVMTLDQPGEGRMRLALAGHPPPLLVAGGETTEISAAGPVLGAFEDADWELKTLDLDPGAQLFAYTDGVTEARGATERFGEERLADVLSRAKGPEHAIDIVDRAIDGFREGELEDDAAFLAMMRMNHA